MAASPAPLLIVKTGETLAAIRARRGDFEDWIRAGLALADRPIELLRVHQGEPLPEPGRLSGLVITGSSAMVSAGEPWSEQTALWLRGAVAAGTPILGICYGHQLLAHALGGRVGPNPAGREIGTIRVELRAEGDPLLGVLPRRITVQATHVESVLALPPGVASLGASALDPHQAFRAGPLAWGVQFHPEFDADVMRGYLEARRPIIESEGLDAGALCAEVRDSEHGTLLLRRFAELLRARAGFARGAPGG